MTKEKENSFLEQYKSIEKAITNFCFCKCCIINFWHTIHRSPLAENLPLCESVRFASERFGSSILLGSTNLRKITAKLAVIFRLTTEIPQTDFCFDHLTGTPSQECPPYFVYSGPEFEGHSSKSACLPSQLFCLQKQVSSWELMTPTAWR